MGSEETCPPHFRIYAGYLWGGIIYIRGAKEGEMHMMMSRCEKCLPRHTLPCCGPRSKLDDYCNGEHEVLLP